jgi:4-hydroxy-4-methyl-2-oxoglutarate aldolase
MPAKPLDPANIATIRDRLHTAVLGDTLDVMGLRRQFLPQAVRPLLPDVRLVGRAMTVREEDIISSGGDGDFGRMFEALDQIGPGEIYVAAGGAGGYAMWGELMSRTARARGAVGAVVSGPMRDTPAVRNLGFQVFSSGSYALDQRGRGLVTDYRCRLDFGGVTVNDGDIVVGDEDGVLIVPEAALEECLSRALAKIGIEDEIGARLEEGADSKALFDKFGVM